MTNYQKAVDQNLKHMKTPASEWTAVAVSGMAEETDAPDGRPMPTFEFPVNYEHAPTLYPNSGPEMCCELCSHPIKMAYWLQNDSKKWVLLVGSECVTHFAEGKSGQRLTKEAIWEANREQVRTYKALVAKFEETFKTAKRTTTEWSYSAGYYSRTQATWDYRTPRAALTAHASLAKLLENTHADARPRQWIEASTDAVITRWIKKNTKEAEAHAEVLMTAIAAMEAAKAKVPA